MSTQPAKVRDDTYALYVVKHIKKYDSNNECNLEKTIEI